MPRFSFVKILASIAIFSGATGVTALILDSPQPPSLSAPSSIDMGDQAFGSVAVGRFKITNEGGRPLTVGPFASSCSCAGVEVDRATPEGVVWTKVSTLTVEPGASQELAVRVAVGGKIGQYQNVTIAANTNDPIVPSWQLSVAIPRITGGVHCEPGALVFDPTTSDARRSGRILVYANGDSSRRVTGASTSPSGRFVSRILPVPRGTAVHQIAGEAIGLVEVELLDLRPGLVWGKLVIEINGVPQSQHEQIVLTGEVLENDTGGSNR